MQQAAGWLLDSISEPYSAVSERSVDEHIYNLRRRIEDTPSHAVYIKSVRGLGYRVRTPLTNCSQGRVPSASEYRRKQGLVRSVGRRALCARLPSIFALVFRAASLHIAYHASPTPRLWPCSSSESRTPRKETGSVFSAAGCCSTSIAVRCELSRLRLWGSLLPLFV